MTTSHVAQTQSASRRTTAVGRLYLLDLSGGRVLSLNADGSDKTVLATNCNWPDGVAVDADAGHVYWTNMGVPHLNDGSIERADLDGGNRRTIVPEGATFTPKQLHLNKESGKLYWCDREGMRVMRCSSTAPASRPSSTPAADTPARALTRQSGASESRLI